MWGMGHGAWGMERGAWGMGRHPIWARGSHGSWVGTGGTCETRAHARPGLVRCYLSRDV